MKIFKDFSVILCWDPPLLRKFYPKLSQDSLSGFIVEGMILMIPSPIDYKDKTR